jgi:hypothetical protein
MGRGRAVEPGHATPLARVGDRYAGWEAAEAQGSTICIIERMDLSSLRLYSKKLPTVPAL